MKFARNGDSCKIGVSTNFYIAGACYLAVLWPLGRMGGGAKTG
jgi:hypothetical protein